MGIRMVTVVAGIRTRALASDAARRGWHRGVEGAHACHDLGIGHLGYALDRRDEV